jgi:hypothetical protein
MTEQAPEPRWIDEEAVIRYLGGNIPTRTLRDRAATLGIRGKIGQQIRYDARRLDELVQIPPSAVTVDGPAPQE